VYATTSPATAWLESGSGRSAVWAGPWDATDVPTMNAANDGPWATACWNSTTGIQLARVSLAGTGGSSPVVLSPPAGTSLWSGPTTNGCPGVDTEGSAFQLFIGQSVQAYRASDLASWQPLGAPMGGIASAVVVESGGTYLIGGGTISGPPWIAGGGPGASLGTQLQVVRPSSQASVTLPGADWTNGTYPGYLMTQDGGCVAYFESGALALADARAGVVHPTALTIDTSRPDVLVGWTNIPGDGQVWTELGD
jgi:hypothetical protein